MLFAIIVRQQLEQLQVQLANLGYVSVILDTALAPAP